MNFRLLMRGVVLALSAFGTVAGATLSSGHLQYGEVCPMLGPVPACNIVFLGYTSIFLAGIFFHSARSRVLFYAGWFPVFLLAFVGVSLELINGNVCPPGIAGIPQCYFSLAMILTCLVCYRYAREALI